jgi:hypothetical protein
VYKTESLRALYNAGVGHIKIRLILWLENARNFTNSVKRAEGRACKICQKRIDKKSAKSLIAYRDYYMGRSGVIMIKIKSNLL